ncbi:unnamed protein product [Phaedon cochleariae]|uniref:Small ribosomal subunit protein mS31 n=1 Tax=Phaedon cochleariae TaxID=80249 RepID=A0A9P0DQV9_PHACE|nr:unnamed protein product [Phaedon cochleariae]
MKSLSALRCYKKTENGTLIERFRYSISSKQIFFGNNREKSTKSGGSSSSSDSCSSSDSDNEATRKKTVPQIKSQDTLNKLNNLLMQLVEQDVVAKASELQLAKPTNKRMTKNAQREDPKHETKEKQMVEAAKHVAKELGGNVNETESELLMKLLNTMEPQPATPSLTDIVKGMKIDRTTKNAQQTRADQIRNILQEVHSKHKGEGTNTDRRLRKAPQHRQKQDVAVQRIDLFGSDPLGIFTNKSNLKEVPGNTMWKKLWERDLKLAVTHPPSNHFQQMILWTEQGKLWKFPIDNEQDLEEERTVSFAEHVFLEEHLEPWCPPRGPIRHFMELVCVGLSKNSYLTVQAKKDHIDWFKNYFEDKKQLLQEVGALPTESQKQVE